MTGLSSPRLRKIRAVSRFELLSAVRRPSYLVMTFGLPLFFGLLAGLPAMVQGRMVAEQVGRVVHFGIVDHAELIDFEPGQYTLETLELHVIADEDTARAALERGEIGGYFVVTPDYRDDGKVQVYRLAGAPPLDVGGESAERTVRRLLVTSLLEGSSPELRLRVLDPMMLERMEVSASDENVAPWIPSRPVRPPTVITQSPGSGALAIRSLGIRPIVPA